MLSHRLDSSTNLNHSVCHKILHVMVKKKPWWNSVTLRSKEKIEFCWKRCQTSCKIQNQNFSILHRCILVIRDHWIVKKEERIWLRLLLRTKLFWKDFKRSKLRIQSRDGKMSLRSRLNIEIWCVRILMNLEMDLIWRQNYKEEFKLLPEQEVQQIEWDTSKIMSKTLFLE